MNGVVIGLSASNPPEIDLVERGLTADDYLDWLGDVVDKLVQLGARVVYAGDDRVGGVTRGVETRLGEEGRQRFEPMRRSDPAAAVADVRRAMVGLADGWLAIGGAWRSDGSSGVVAEIDLALDHDLPVIVDARFGGAVTRRTASDPENLSEVPADASASSVATAVLAAVEWRRS